MPGVAMEIPAAPVVIPLALLALVALVWSLRRRGGLSVPRVAVAVLTCAYGGAVLREVLFPFAVNTGAHRNQVAWWVYLQFVPLVTADPIGVVLNVALFVPLGLLLPIVARVGTARRVLVVALLVSLTIEIVQLVGDITVSTGRVADIDDLIGNTVGALVGFAVFRAAVRLPALARLATTATWPAARSGADAERPSAPMQVAANR